MVWRKLFTSELLFGAGHILIIEHFSGSGDILSFENIYIQIIWLEAILGDIY